MMLVHRLVLALLVLFGFSSGVSVSLEPNATVAEAGNGVSNVLAPSFAGMSIEPANLFFFMGDESPNYFAINLLTNLANYTGFPPTQRIGGNTQDNTVYSSSFNEFYVQQNLNPKDPDANPTDHFIIGPRYFEVLNRLPPNTPVVYGLNLAYDLPDFIQNIVNQAEAAMSMLSRVRIASFEIGNEPDGYSEHGFRSGPYSGRDYVSEWIPRAAAVYQQVLKSRNLSANFFESACTASTIYAKSFQIQDLATETPLLDPARNTSNDDDVSYVSSWNQHDYYYFQGVSDYALQLDQLMDLSTTRAQFGYWAEQVQQALATGLPYALREMGSIGPRGQPGLSDVFGATLWTFNFFLYAASLNISSVEFHMTVDSYASPFSPAPYKGITPQVRSTYYAWAAIDQLIGGGCATRVASISIAAYPPGYKDRLAAYATYQHNSLAALVLINTKVANATTPNKGNVNFDLSLQRMPGETLYLAFLTADGADSLYNTTWNGISFESSGNGTGQVVDGDVQTVRVSSSGLVSVSVRDSQAVVVSRNQNSGIGLPSRFNATACQALGFEQRVPSGYPPLSCPSQNAKEKKHQKHPKAPQALGIYRVCEVKYPNHYIGC